MYILFILLLLFIFFVFLLPTLILSVIARVLALFGFASRKKTPKKQSNVNFDDDKAAGHKPSGTVGGKKIFDKSEGEYVDFEEIK